MSLRLTKFRKLFNLLPLVFGAFSVSTREVARPFVKHITGLSDKMFFENMIVGITPADIFYIGFFGFIVCSIAARLNKQK
jgi:hypothetical protein